MQRKRFFIVPLTLTSTTYSVSHLAPVCVAANKTTTQSEPGPSISAALSQPHYRFASPSLCLLPKCCTNYSDYSSHVNSRSACGSFPFRKGLQPRFHLVAPIHRPPQNIASDSTKPVFSSDCRPSPLHLPPGTSKCRLFAVNNRVVDRSIIIKLNPCS